MLAFAIQDAESALIEIMAWVPVFTPFLLILRMPTEPPLWEVFAQLGLMAFTTFLILYLATRVYRAGAVHGAGVNDVWAFLHVFRIYRNFNSMLSIYKALFAVSTST